MLKKTVGWWETKKTKSAFSPSTRSQAQLLSFTSDLSTSSPCPTAQGDQEWALWSVPNILSRPLVAPHTFILLRHGSLSDAFVLQFCVSLLPQTVEFFSVKRFGDLLNWVTWAASEFDCPCGVWKEQCFAWAHIGSSMVTQSLTYQLRSSKRDSCLKLVATWNWGTALLTTGHYAVTGILNKYILVL